MIEKLVDGEAALASPQVLPGGKAVLFVDYPSLDPDKASIDVFTFADRRRKVVARGGVSARYLPTSEHSGHLLYSNKGTLFAIPFDLDKLETRGTAVPFWMMSCTRRKPRMRPSSPSRPAARWSTGKAPPPHPR